MTPPRLLTVKAFTEALNVSVPMGYKLIRDGAIPVVRIGASVRIHPEDLAAFVESRRGKQQAAR